MNKKEIENAAIAALERLDRAIPEDRDAIDRWIKQRTAGSRQFILKNTFEGLLMEFIRNAPDSIDFTEFALDIVQDKLKALKEIEGD